MKLCTCFLPLLCLSHACPYDLPWFYEPDNIWSAVKIPHYYTSFSNLLIIPVIYTQVFFWTLFSATAPLASHIKFHTHTKHPIIAIWNAAYSCFQTFGGILCFVDRASRYIHLQKNQLDAQFIFSVFRQTPLHVSVVCIAHHQEVQPYVYSNWYLLFFLDDPLLCWLSQDNWQSSKKNSKYQLLYTYGVPPDDGL